MNKSENAELIDLCQSAFHAEHYGQFDAAYKMHTAAIQGLTKLVNDAGFGDRERKRVARKQLKFHVARQQIIRPIKEGTQTHCPVMLPTSISAREEMLAVTNGAASLSLEELWLAKYQTKKKTNPALTAEPEMQHLLQVPVPYYTPTLDPDLPVVSYHIYISKESMIVGGHVYYLKAKSASDDRQTLYVLQAYKPSRYQISTATLHRSAEFTNPCVRVAITGVKPSTDRVGSRLKGRPMQFHTPSPRVIVEKPDRLERQGWGPRRFSYGGRQFVWETEDKNEWQPQTLYEVEKTWPKEGSTTGKMEHKVLERKLVWGENKGGLKKVAVINMVGGMDQVFREYLLASQLTRLAVVMHGH